MTMTEERVYQAEPSTCVQVAREHLDSALERLRADEPDLAEVLGHVHQARFWLPSWLTEEWDDRMTAWMERERATREP